MTKVTILISLFMMCCLTLFSQNHDISNVKETTKGVNITEYAAFAYGYTTNINITLNTGKSIFSIGPSFGRSANYDRYSGWPKKGTFTLIGILGTYKFNPNPKGKVVDFYFVYDIYWHYYPAKGTTNYGGTEYNYIVREHFIGQEVGYGFNIKFLRKLYINHNLGVGIGHKTYNYNSTEDKYNNKKNETVFDLILKIGIGYEF